MPAAVLAEIALLAEHDVALYAGAKAIHAEQAAPGAALPSGVAASIPLQLGPQLPAEVQLFISQLLEPRPELRLGAGSCGSHDVRSHAFFTGWNWSKMAWD